MRRKLLEPGVLMGMVLLIAGILLTGCSGEPTGAELYALNCASCHGVAGKGGIATALGLPAYLATHDDAMIAQFTREGIPNTGMRAFGKANGGRLTDEQIAVIVKYLRSVSASN